MVKNLPAVQETQEMRVQSLGQEDPLEEDMATHSSILAWDSLVKNTGVDCHALLQGIFLRDQSCVSYASCIGRWVLCH